MNSIFGMFMESWIIRVSCKVSEAAGFTLTLQETRGIHEFMNIPKIDFIAYIYIYYKHLNYKKLFLI